MNFILAYLAVGNIQAESFSDGFKNAIWQLFGLMALVCFFASAILFLALRNNSDKIQKARVVFIMGVISMIVGILAYLTVVLIQLLF